MSRAAYAFLAALWVDVRVPLGDWELIEAALLARAAQLAQAITSEDSENALAAAACLLTAKRLRMSAARVTVAANRAAAAFDQWRD